jgi:hypothetical protein
MPDAKCIYCSTIFEPTKGEGDHIIPAALGEFRNDTHFRGCCNGCNIHIGKSEQVLLHCGPEAFFRRVVNPALPSSRQRGRSYVKAAMGVPGLSHTIDRGDHAMKVCPSRDNAKIASGVDQLVIQDSEGGDHFFPLFPKMDADTLKGDILKAVPPPIPKAWLHCHDPQHYEEFLALFRKMFPQAEHHSQPSTPVGMHPANARIRFTVNAHYWRSLAKIGFHYYLSQTRRGVRGDEPGFAVIRDFIINGGDMSRLFRQPKTQFVLPFGELAEGGIKTPTQWCHILAANETNNEVIAYVQLFIGPGCIPTPHYIVLGTLNSDVVGLSSFIQAHVYLYDQVQNPSGTAGVVEKAAVTLYPKDLIPRSHFLANDL